MTSAPPLFSKAQRTGGQIQSITDHQQARRIPPLSVALFKERYSMPAVIDIGVGLDQQNRPLASITEGVPIRPPMSRLKARPLAPRYLVYHLKTYVMTRTRVATAGVAQPHHQK